MHERYFMQQFPLDLCCADIDGEQDERHTTTTRQRHGQLMSCLLPVHPARRRIVVQVVMLYSKVSVLSQSFSWYVDI